MNVLKVNGTALHTPDEMEITEADLQTGAYRDETGYIHKTTVRYGVRTLKCKWDTMTGATLAALRSACKGKEYISVDYLTDTGDMGTITAYTGNLTHKLNHIYKGKPYYTDIALDFIEQ